MMYSVWMTIQMITYDQRFATRDRRTTHELLKRQTYRNVDEQGAAAQQHHDRVAHKREPEPLAQSLPRVAEHRSRHLDQHRGEQRRGDEALSLDDNPNDHVRPPANKQEDKRSVER